MAGFKHGSITIEWKLENHRVACEKLAKWTKMVKDESNLLFLVKYI